MSASCHLVRRVLVLLAFCLLHQATANALQTPDHRLGGLLFDSFSLRDGTDVHQWVVEDGSRVRYRLNHGTWEWQDIPDPGAKYLLRRVFFLNPDDGWAVGQNGALLYTDNGGADWILLDQIVSPTTGLPADLYDIKMLPSGHGWLVGTKDIWATANFGYTANDWTACTTTHTGYQIEDIELYSIAVEVMGSDPNTLLGIVVAEPGIALRSFASLPLTTNQLALTSWSLSFSVLEDFCPPPAGWRSCAKDICPAVGGPGDTIRPVYEPWVVKILVDATEEKELVLMGGGVKGDCGLIFSSLDAADTFEWEPHECEVSSASCDLDPDYYCYDVQTTSGKKHCKFLTVYDIVEFQHDGTALSVGYNGQCALRLDGVSTTAGTWLDRSTFAGAFFDSSAIVLPLMGVSGYVDALGNKITLIAGSAGTLRETDGTTWDVWKNCSGAVNHPSQEIEHDPWRLRDIHFWDDMVGWRVGQFGRISKTMNAGFSWEPEDPDPVQTNPYLNAIAIAPDGNRGVSVGNRLGTGAPMVMYNDNLATADWQAPTSMPVQDNRDLLDVCWAGDTGTLEGVFWCVGQGGLILVSLSQGAGNNGAAWQVVNPPNAYNTEFSGVAFSASGNFHGMIVGKGRHPGTSPTDPVQGVAYRWNPSTSTWVDATPDDSNLTLLTLTAVTISGSNAWAVGEKLVGSDVEGIVLRYDGGTSRFVEVATGLTIAQCRVGKDIGEFPVLSAVAVASNGEVFAGGGCGLLIVGTPQGQGYSWREVKSLTSGHIRSLSFTTDTSGYVGFIGTHRDDENTMQSIIRVRE